MNEKSKTNSSRAEGSTSKTTEVARIGNVWVILKVETEVENSKANRGHRLTNEDASFQDHKKFGEWPELDRLMVAKGVRYFFAERCVTEDGGTRYKLDTSAPAPSQTW